MRKSRFKQYFEIFLWYWLPVVIWALIIFSFSARPTRSVSEVHWQDFLFKKTVHVCEYAVFALMNFRALKKSGIKENKAFFISFFISLFYGGTDEFHQSFTPGREPTIRDILIDTLGASLAIFFVIRVLPYCPAPIKTLFKKLEIS